MSFQVGHRNYNLVVLPETKEKISVSKNKRKKRLGYTNSPTARKKMSIAKKGKAFSLPHRQHISQSMKGKPSGAKGKHWKVKNSSLMGKGRLGKGTKMVEYPENIRIRKSVEYIYWRKAIFERDNFTCQKCGQRGGKLVVHHINNFADFPGNRLAIDNGITLCEKCHKEFHKKYGKHNNTKEQLEEFFNNK